MSDKRRNKMNVNIGDVVLIHHGIGIIRFIGELPHQNSVYCGIELKEKDNKLKGCNGEYNGKQYFKVTKQKHGVFVKISKIDRVISSEEILNKLSSIYYESYHLKRKVTRLNKEISDIKYKLSKYESKDMNTYHNNINTNEFHDSDNDVIKDIDIMFSDPHKKIGEMDEYNEYNEIKIHNDSDDDLNGNIITQNMLENADKIISDMLYQYHKSDRIIIESCYATKTGVKKGKKGNNQDSYFIFEDLIPTNNQQNIVQFYGVLDGHGPSGHKVSQYCSKYLPKILVSNEKMILLLLNKPDIALEKAFEMLEKQLINDKLNNNIDFDINYSGTTITCCLCMNDTLYFANLGDSRTLLGKLNTHTNKISMHQMCQDHDPTNPKETNRINKSKLGQIKYDDDGNARIEIKFIDNNINNHSNNNNNNNMDSDLNSVKSISASVSRSIGDKIAHDYGGVISIPEITIHNINNNDIFIVLGSDGIWTVIENDDIMRIIGTKLLHNNYSNNLQKLTDGLVREANIVWTDEFDNYIDDITCIIARIGKRSQYIHSL